MFTQTHIIGDEKGCVFVGFLKDGNLYYESKLFRKDKYFFLTIENEITRQELTMLALAFLDSCIVSIEEHCNIATIKIFNDFHNYRVID